MRSGWRTAGPPRPPRRRLPRDRCFGAEDGWGCRATGPAIESTQVICGINGTNGSDGAVGATGPQGATGAQGAAGNDGSNGTNGAVGATGPQGATGAQGAAGSDGSNGTNGTNGSDGAVGATGPQGATGAQGAAGSDGSNGTNGTNGSDGAVGATGPQGAAGSDGSNGTNGAVGAVGAQGATGAAGPGSVGNVYVIPGDDSDAGGLDYLSLSTPNGHVELRVWCMKNVNGAYWLANDAAVTAGAVTIVNHVVVDSKQDGNKAKVVFHKDLVNGGGAQDATLDNGGNADGGKMHWNANFTAIEGGTYTRWHVTLSNFLVDKGDCTVVVYDNNGGAASIVIVP